MNEFKMHGRCKFFAFTLAEMMIVLLIMTIILAVMAPVVTTRMRDGGSGGGSVLSPWLWTDDNARKDAYLASPDINNTRAAIGFRKNNIPNDGNGQARLLLNTSDNVRNHIGFYDKGSYIGTIAIDHDMSNLLFGDFDSETHFSGSNVVIALYNNHDGDNDKYNTVLGYKNLTRLNSTSNGDIKRNVSIGSHVLENTQRSSQNVAIGADSLNALFRGSHNIAIGSSANHEVADIAHYYSSSCPSTGSTCDLLDTLAIGGYTRANRSWAMAIGKFATAEGERAIAIGASNVGRNKSANALADDSIAIGTNSTAYENCVALGNGAKAGSADTPTSTENINSIAIGTGAKATFMRSVAIGSASESGAEQSYAMGYKAKASGKYSSALGIEAQATKEVSTALGYKASATANHSIAIGNAIKPETTWILTEATKPNSIACTFLSS